MEQFVRGDRSRHSEGSGLGLYIARSLTELIGGEFKMDIIGDLFQITLILPQAQQEAANSKKLCILGEAIHDRDDDISVDDQSLASA